MTKPRKPHVHAREAVLSALEAAGWKVVRLARGDAYYTTPAGRTSTLCLHPYEGRPEVWRWHIDHLTVRARGRLTMIAPHPPRGRQGHTELTCAEEELPTLAEWLPRWLLAFDGVDALPASPCSMSLPDGKHWEGGYVWTLKAQERYRLLKATERR